MNGRECFPDLKAFLIPLWGRGNFLIEISIILTLLFWPFSSFYLVMFYFIVTAFYIICSFSIGY